MVSPAHRRQRDHRTWRPNRWVRLDATSRSCPGIDVGQKAATRHCRQVAWSLATAALRRVVGVGDDQLDAARAVLSGLAQRSRLEDLSFRGAEVHRALPAPPEMGTQAHWSQNANIPRGAATSDWNRHRIASSAFFVTLLIQVSASLDQNRQCRVVARQVNHDAALPWISTSAEPCTHSRYPRALADPIGDSRECSNSSNMPSLEQLQSTSASLKVSRYHLSGTPR